MHQSHGHSRRAVWSLPCIRYRSRSVLQRAGPVGQRPVRLQPNRRFVARNHCRIHFQFGRHMSFVRFRMVGTGSFRPPKAPPGSVRLLFIRWIRCAHNDVILVIRKTRKEKTFLVGESHYFEGNVDSILMPVRRKLVSCYTGLRDYFDFDLQECPRLCSRLNPRNLNVYLESKYQIISHLYNIPEKTKSKPKRHYAVEVSNLAY